MLLFKFTIEVRLGLTWYNLCDHGKTCIMEIYYAVIQVEELLERFMLKSIISLINW